MSDHALDPPPKRPDVSGLVTEDDEPVDNIQSEKLQRLLTSALYASWSGPPPVPYEEDAERAKPRPFLAAANVGVFHSQHDPPIVPDVFVSTDVSLDELSWADDERRAYFVWEMGKPPELVIEIVSNRKGDEVTRKRRRYGRMHVSCYVVFDPRRLLGGDVLQIFLLQGDLMLPSTSPPLFEQLGLGLTLWTGTFEGTRSTWLRFTDTEGNLLLTGDERAEQEKQRAEQEKQRAEQEKQRAEQEKQRAEQEKQRADREAAEKNEALARIAELEAQLSKRS